MRGTMQLMMVRVGTRDDHCGHNGGIGVLPLTVSRLRLWPIAVLVEQLLNEHMHTQVLMLPLHRYTRVEARYASVV
jgi:hypothetical protein